MVDAEFFKTLYQFCDNGKINIRPIPGTNKAWFCTVHIVWCWNIFRHLKSRYFIFGRQGVFQTPPAASGQYPSAPDPCCLPSGGLFQYNTGFFFGLFFGS